MKLRHLLLIVLAAGTLIAAGCSKQQPQQTAPPAPAKAPPAKAMPTEQPPQQTTLKVAAACGVAGPYGEVRKLFKKQHPDVKIEQEIGNIVKMANKLRDGRINADLFMTIGSTAIGKLQDEGLLVEKPTTFATDLLVVLVPEGNPGGIEKFADLAEPNVETLGVAAGKSMPGRFAEMALKRADLWEKVEDKIVRPDMPSMLKSFVSNGKADAAVMLLTCATKEAKMGEEPAKGVPNAEIALRVPHKYYDRLNCQIGILKQTENPELAREFVKFMKTQKAQDIMSKWDFQPCNDET